MYLARIILLLFAIDHVRTESIDQVRPETTEHLRAEPIDHIRANPISRARTELVDEVKTVSIDEVRTDPINEPQTEPVDDVGTDPTDEDHQLSQEIPLTNIDLLVHSLNSQHWNVNETPCIDTMMKTLANAKNFTLWAVWMLDSLQLPTGQLYGVGSHLGNFDECLSPHRVYDVTEDIPKFKYCVTDYTLTSDLEKGSFSRNPNDTAVSYLNKRTIFRKSLAKALWGLCVPKVCEPQSVKKIAHALLQTSHLGAMDSTATIEVEYCKNRKNEGYSLGFYVFMGSILIVSVMTVSVSYYSWTHPSPRDSFVGELARSFCLERNMKELTKLRDDEIYSMNLIRIISSVLIVGGHYVMTIFLHTTVNLLDAEELLYKTDDTLLHLDLTTDTFFTISGLLFMRGLFTDKWKNPLKYMWKRYIRLIIGIAISTAIMAVVLECTTDGPLWDLIPLEEINVCKTNWWHSLAMIQNVVDSKNMCNLVSWYVPCDFQLSILAVLLFCVYKSNNRLGIQLGALTVAAGAILSGLTNYWFKYKPIPFSGLDIYPRHADEFYDNFVKPYTHTSTFMIGAVMGYIMYKYKPKDYRKCISQFWSYLGVAVALVLMRLCLYGGHYYYIVSSEVTELSALYTATNRAVWSASLCAIIVICEYGDIPILQKTMAWFPMVPISRLSYTAYLLQHPVELYHVGSLRSLVHCDDYQIALVTIGVSLFCYVASLFIWLFVEGPIVNINNMLTYKTWKNTKESNTKEATHSKVMYNGNGKHD